VERADALHRFFFTPIPEVFGIVAVRQRSRVGININSTDLFRGRPQHLDGPNHIGGGQQFG
jgi:hypothetical protein